MNIYSSRVSNLLLREQEVGNRWKCIRPPRTCAYPECKIKTCNVNASSRHIESHPPSFEPSSKCTLGSRCTLFVYIPFHPPSISPPGDGCPLPLRPRQFSMSRITRCRFLFFSFSAERAEFSVPERERRTSRVQSMRREITWFRLRGQTNARM